MDSVSCRKSLPISYLLHSFSSCRLGEIDGLHSRRIAAHHPHSSPFLCLQTQTLFPLSPTRSSARRGILLSVPLLSSRCSPALNSPAISAEIPRAHTTRIILSSPTPQPFTRGSFSSAWAFSGESRNYTRWRSSGCGSALSN